MRRMETIGQRIKRLRTERGIGQDRLALRADVDQSGLSKIERGVRKGLSLAFAERIADALEVPVADLLRDTNYEHLIVGGGSSD